MVLDVKIFFTRLWTYLDIACLVRCWILWLPLNAVSFPMDIWLSVINCQKSNSNGTHSKVTFYSKAMPSSIILLEHFVYKNNLKQKYIFCHLEGSTLFQMLIDMFNIKQDPVLHSPRQTKLMFGISKIMTTYIPKDIITHYRLKFRLVLSLYEIRLSTALAYSRDSRI